MDSVVRNVIDLSADERHVYESVFGQPLQNNQKIVVQLLNAENGESELQADVRADVLAPYAMWANVSDEEVAELETVILERSESRPM